MYAGGTALLAVEARTGTVRWRYDALRAADPSDRRQAFSGDSSPLVAGDHVYAGRDDGYLVALDRRTGACVWKFRLGLPVKSSPVVSGNMLFVCGFDGELYAFASRAK